jgi:transformation/transcription domain-associated protein
MIPVQQQQEEKLSHPAVLETARLAKSMMSYIASQHSEVSALFELIAVFKLRSRVDYSFVAQFIKSEVRVPPRSLDVTVSRSVE